MNNLEIAQSKLKYSDHEFFIKDNNEDFKYWNQLYLSLTQLDNLEDIIFTVRRADCGGVIQIDKNKLSIRVDADKGKLPLFWIEYDIINNIIIFF